jgi:DNA-binding SARP family transcriptional activator
VTAAPRIRLFGELDARLGGAPLPPLESARARSLLAYLLVHDAPQPRQRLAFVLWPDSPEGQARTNLRHLLHTLRRTGPWLEPFVETTAQTVRWRSELPCWVDVAAFDAALARAEAAPAGSEEAAAALRAAVDLYGGDLLEGCYDEWIGEVRDRYRDRYRAALRQLTSLLAERGGHAEAVRLGRELVRCDPLQEDAYRLLMRVHDGAGDRAGAVRVYHECVTTLRRELGVDPSPATAAAYAILVAPAVPSVPAPAPTPPSPIAGATPLVGRAAEWGSLNTCWQAAEAGRAQAVLVTGEPGVGKTRLVEELAAWCAHRGAVVAHARSYPAEGELGYGVVLSWLRAPGVAAHRRRLPGPMLAELGRLLPELDAGAASPAQDPGPEALDHADRRRRLFDAVARALLAPGRPTLLVADDAQWSDVESLQLVHYLMRVEPGARLLVAATARREELAADHPLVALTGGLQVLDRVTEIAVRRLGRDEAAELARRLVGDTMGAAAADALFAETEGNPLFIVEALRAGWDGAGPAPPALTPKLQAVIAARLRRLSPAALDLLGLAATVGREFTAAVLAAATGFDDDALVGALDELWRVGVVREQGTDAYDFAHGKIRDVAYDELSPALRRSHHARVAGALRSLHGRDPDAVSGEIARHLDRAGEVAEAITWYGRAAVQAQRRYANVEALRLLERARALVARLPDDAGRPARELAVLSAIPTPLAVADGFASPLLAEVQARALDLAARVGLEPDASLLRSVVLTNLCRDDFEGARTVAERLERKAAEAGDGVLGVECGYLLGIAAFWDGAFARARRHFERVVHDFDPARRAEHVLRFGLDPRIVCQSRLGNTLWFLGHVDEAWAASDEAVARAADVQDPFTRAVALVFAAALAVDAGEPDRYREHVAALGSGRDVGPARTALEGFLGLVDVLDGRVDEGFERIRGVIDLARTVDQAPGQRAMMIRLLLAGHEAAVDAEGGLATAAEALRLGGTRIWEAEIRRLRARFLADLAGPRHEVAAELDRAVAVARRQGAAGLERRVEATRRDLGLAPVRGG